MNQKRSSGFRFLLLGIGGLVFVSFAVIAGVLINRQFFSPPDIQIIQPIEPLLINSGEGIILISHANSTSGIDRVEFLVNDSFHGLTKAENEDARELVAQFPWMPAHTGVYDLSVIAYDKNNRASNKSSIPIGVISQNLPTAEISKIEEDLEKIPTLNVAAPLEYLNDGISDGSQFGDEGNQDSEDQDRDENQEQEEIQHIHFDRIAGLPVIFGSNPPQITSLEVEIESVENRVTVIATAAAVDDVGVQKIKVSAYKPGINDPVYSLVSLCDETETCDYRNILEINEGDYVIVAIAIDTSLQSSEIMSKNIRVPSPVDEENQDIDPGQELEFDIPEGFLDHIALIDLDDQEPASSLPPDITSFTVQAIRPGPNPNVDIRANAEDDNGIAAFSVTVFNDADDSFVDSISPLCQGALNCDIFDQLSLADGSYVLIAEAFDIDQNQSEAGVRTIQVLSTHPEEEPPSIVVGRYSHLIPAEAINSFNLHNNGVFERPPHSLDFEGDLEGDLELDEEFLEIPDDLGCGDECEANTLDYIEVDIWYQPATRNMDAQIVIAINVPPGIPLPDGQSSYIKIWDRSRMTANQIYIIMPLTQSVVERGAYKESRINASLLCNAADFYMDLRVGENYGPSEFVDRVHLGELELLLCTPPTPRLTNLSAFTTYGDYIGRNMIQWTQVLQSDGVFYTFIDRILITKKVILPEGIVTNEIFIDFRGGQFADYDVMPNTVYEYSLRVVGTNGYIGRSSNYLNVRTPPEGANYFVDSTDWQPNR